LGDQAICPQCGQPLDEPIPQALVGSIQVKCPFCDMVYSFQRQEDVGSLKKEVESYLSVGPFRRKLVVGVGGKPREGDSSTRLFSCLVLCLVGPMIIFGIYWVITYLVWLYSRF